VGVAAEAIFRCKIKFSYSQRRFSLTFGDESRSLCLSLHYLEDIFHSKLCKSPLSSSGERRKKKAARDNDEQGWKAKSQSM
jgi:hypothetical protein